MTTRIDTASLSTAATRALAERQDILTEQIAKRREDFTAEAQKMTIAELKAGIGGAPLTGKVTGKAEWMEQYVQAQTRVSVYSRTLQELKVEAARDEWLANQINHLIDRSDEADERLRKITADNSGAAMFYNLRSALDESFAAQVAARWATQVVKLVDEGMELREAALLILGQAMQKVFSFPSSVRYNGLAGGMRMEDMIEANGAITFRDTVAAYLGEDVTVSIDFIRR